MGRDSPCVKGQGGRWWSVSSNKDNKDTRPCNGIECNEISKHQQSMEIDLRKRVTQ